MAKINNQDVMQKLIDELNLYPGKDVIPTELAEKILPVFQVNSDEVEVKTPTANIVRTATMSSAVTQTIYTVPATGKFYLTNLSLVVDAPGGSTATYEGSISVTIDGTAQKVGYAKVYTNVGGSADGKAQVVTLNFQNPILLDQSSTIDLDGGNGAYKMGMIVGYTEAD